MPFLNSNYVPYVFPGENKTGFCIRECFKFLEAEVSKQAGLDLRVMIFLGALGITWAVINFYILKKFKWDDKITRKAMLLYFNLSGMVGLILFFISLKFLIGFTGIF